LFRIAELETPDEIARFCSLGSLAPAELSLVPGRAADKLLLAYGPSGEAMARCGLWHKAGQVDGRDYDALGFYHAEDFAAGTALLEFACRLLGERGSGWCIGPLDGNTWRGYRLVSEAMSLPPFFLEPHQPVEWVKHFEAAGFCPFATYHSSLAEDLDQIDAAAANHQQVRVAQTLAGITIRPFRLEAYEQELRRVFELTMISFRQNLLFTPIDFAEFSAIYAPLRPRVIPELFLLAERAGTLLGFVFAIPDYRQPARGAALDTVVIKSLAVHPAATNAGLGACLVDQCHLAAGRLGFRHAIHAMMHDDNISVRISRRTAKVIRRYALFSRKLLSAAP
jgi:GNAT superfamily N-acetyltransferase